jgi:YVTN family beta-propeller protein
MKLLNKLNSSRSIAFTLPILLISAFATLAPHAGAQPGQLVTGKRITLPSPGEPKAVGSLPMNMALTPDQRFAVCSDMGFRQSLWAIDARTGRGVSHVDFPRGTADGLYYGLAMQQAGADTLVYAAEGGAAAVLVARLGPDGALARSGTLKLKPGDLAAGLALDSRGYLYVAINTFSVNSNDIRVMTTPGSLAVLDTKSGEEIGRWKFGRQLSNFPLAVEALRDGSRVYVTSQRDGTVTVLDTSDPAAIKQVAVVSTGAHPDALTLDRAQRRLFVANAHSDTLSVLDTVTNRVSGTILLRPRSLGSAAGATPTGLCLTPDEKSLYVALGDMNAVAVVDLAKRAVTGYIPTGWYPTAVVATRAGKVLWSNAKGTRTRNPNGKAVGPGGAWGTYSLSILEGSVAAVPTPGRDELAAYTRQVLENNAPIAARGANPLAGIGLKAGKIKHVIYVIKENRTYDQVLGDLTDAAGRPVGNGDPTLTLYGAKVTPNLHALALRFVTLDNFHDCGEASGDGWPWSTQGIATEYVIKNVPYNYSGRGRKYDFEGQNNGYPVGGFPAVGPDGTPLVAALSPLFPSAPAIADVAEAPGGHIWDSVLKAGLTVRNYGFFLTFGVKLGQAVLLPDNYPDVKPLQPAGHDLDGRTDYDFREFDTSYADSDAPQIYFDRRTQAGAANAAEALYPTRTYGKHNAMSRFSEWNNEFRQMLAKDPTGGDVPNLMMLRLMHDHTQGVRVGAHTPDSEVADNDYSVGQLVEAVSKSPIWESTAIFVIEDDAQDGQDHVDCHRSTCYVISPYIKANSVDHGFYNTDSVLKTMELLLGLPPMSQYDAIAAPIQDWDAAPSNREPYNPILPEEGIIAKLASASPRESRLAALSSKLDFVHPDSADPTILNAILWKYAHGLNSTPPAPRHSLALAPPAAAKSAHRSLKPRAVRRDDDD